MFAFENAQRFFHACETPLGWEGCQAYVAEGASFVAQSEPLVEVKTVQAYCEWIKGFGTVTAAGAHYELHAQGYDHESNERDALEMEALEVLLMGSLGFDNPY